MFSLLFYFVLLYAKPIEKVNKQLGTRFIACAYYKTGGG